MQMYNKMEHRQEDYQLNSTANSAFATGRVSFPLAFPARLSVPLIPS